MTDGTFLSALNEGLQRELEELGARVQFPVDHVLFFEGQPSRSVLIIQQGHTGVTRTFDDGGQALLAIRGPGEMLGIEGVLSGESHMATVKAMSDVVGLDVPADKFMQFVDERQLYPDLMRHAIRRLREADAERVALASLPVKRRLARLLIDLATAMGEEVEDRIEIDLTLSQHDLASRIGASRESITKLMAMFREEGLVTTGRRKLTVLSLDGLRMIASR